MWCKNKLGARNITHEKHARILPQQQKFKKKTTYKMSFPNNLTFGFFTHHFLHMKTALHHIPIILGKYTTIVVGNCPRRGRDMFRRILFTSGGRCWSKKANVIQWSRCQIRCWVPNSDAEMLPVKMVAFQYNRLNSTNIMHSPFNSNSIAVHELGDTVQMMEKDHMSAERKRPMP